MKNLARLSTVAVLPVLFFGAVGQKIAMADSYGDHPHYLHARSNLRRAEALLRLPDESNVKREENNAAWNVRFAIRDIDIAATLDHKDMDDNPPINTTLRHQGKFAEIERLLQNARRDISRDEDNRFALSWRHRAEVHIAQAERRVEIAAQRDRADDSHKYER